jgi:hypothetical protein
MSQLTQSRGLNFFRFDAWRGVLIGCFAYRLGYLECASQMHIDDCMPVLLSHLAERDVAKVPSIIDSDCLCAESGRRVRNRDGHVGMEMGRQTSMRLGEVGG